MPLVSVAVPVPFLDLLTYNVPSHLAMPVVGARVRVPIGSRTVTGCVVEAPATVDAPAETRDLIEISDVEPFLFRQIDVIKPKVIVTLGKFAAQSLLRTDSPITRIRGREFTYRGAVLIPTFHPAYLLRNPSSKREVWEDMKRVRAILTQSAG